MANSLFPESLRNLEAFRRDFVALIELDPVALGRVVEALTDDYETQDVGDADTSAMAVLGLIASQAASEGLTPAEVELDLESFSNELGVAETLDAKRQILRPAFADERIQEERTQRELSLATKYSGSRFQVLAVQPLRGRAGAIAGLHWSIHLHDQDGDSRTVTVVLSQSQAESLRRALTRGIADLEEVRRKGAVVIANGRTDREGVI